MSIVLRVSTGARAGHRETFDHAKVAIGRHPLSELQLDGDRDLDVSARHAQIDRHDGRYTLRDVGSTNGTYVNGVRLAAPRELRAGDVIMLGPGGPRVVVEQLGEAVAAATAVRTPRASRRAEGSPRRATPGRIMAGAALLVAVTLGGAYWASVRTEAVTAEPRSTMLSAAGGIDYTGIASANSDAVVLIAVEMSDGRSYSGSGFGVTEEGDIVTNAHLLEAPNAASLRRIAVIYSGTQAWLPARVSHVDAAEDLAMLQVDREGPFPAVAAIAPPGDAAVVGAAVAIIGYPLGMDTPMDGPRASITARPTLGAGVVSKLADGIVQIDAFAGEGSSGSPVFDAKGRVIAVVYGGARASAGRIVYAIPAERIAALLAGAPGR